jgi:imidazolonepropionase-like amidohydrolase
MGGEADGPQALLAAVAERAERGADVVKVMASGGMITATTDVTKPQYSRGDLRLVVDAAHAAGLPVTAHAHATTAVELSLAAGVDGIEHCTCVGGDRPGMHAPPDLVARLAASGVVVCPTQGHVPGSVYPPNIRAVMDRTGITPEGIVDHVRTLVEGGVRLVAGADSGIYPDKRHGVLPWSLVELVEAGASPVAALAAGTARAADAIGLGARTGRLRPGLDADLLLVDGDAGSDVAAVTRVRTVVSRGRVVRADGP